MRTEAPFSGSDLGEVNRVAHALAVPLTGHAAILTSNQLHFDGHAALYIGANDEPELAPLIVAAEI